MKKSITISMAWVFVILVAFTAAYAANPHLISGPTLSDNGTTFTVSGAVAGLGNTVLTVISVNATATISTTCENPAGKVVPGQSRTESISFSGKFVSDQNGRVNFTITSKDLKPGICPNGQWTGTVNDVSFTSVKLYVDGKLIYQQ